MRLLPRIMVWLCLPAGAFGALLAAVWASEGPAGAALVIYSSGLGPLENWALCFLSLVIGAFAYLLKGMSGGGWRLSLVGVTLPPLLSLSLLLFGSAALAALGLAAAVLYLRIPAIRNRTE